MFAGTVKVSNLTHQRTVFTGRAHASVNRMARICQPFGLLSPTMKTA
jgi:hypothetical protein